MVAIVFKQGRSQRESGAGAGGLEPPQSETHPPWAPNEMKLSTGVYGEPPVWVPVSPPLPHPLGAYGKPYVQ